MATEKIGIYRRWLEPAPKENGVSIPEERWSKERRHNWQLRWFGVSGKRYSKSFNTKKEAEHYSRLLQEKVNNGKSDRPTNISLQAFIAEHEKIMRGQVAYATLYGQVRSLKFFEKFIGGSTLLANIKYREAEAFIAHRLKSGSAIATANKDIRTLKRVFTLAIHRNYIEEGLNPFCKIKERKRSEKPVRYVNIAEYQALMEASERIWWKTFISLAYGSGLRLSEILNMVWQDIDFENKLVRTNPKISTNLLIEWEPKDHEIRTVPITEQSISFLTKMQVTAAEGHPYIFISPQRFKIIKIKENRSEWNSTSGTLNNINRSFEVIRRRSGIHRCTIHDLRRSAITNWAQYLPIQVTQQFAGHSDISTTRKYYISVRSEDIAFASQVINKIMANAKKD
jgi:integrase